MIVSPPFFMLVQNDEILDCCQNPIALLWSLLDTKEDFKVAVGVINEEGRREIVGTCAKFHAQPGGDVFYITSEMDGHQQLVKSSGASDYIRNRICTLFNNGYLSDPCNFSKVELQEGFASE